MARSHGRLGLENKLLENKIWPNFLHSTNLVNQHFILFIHHIWGEQYYEALFLSYRPRTECSFSQLCKSNCTHSTFRTIKARASFAQQIIKLTTSWWKQRAHRLKLRERLPSINKRNIILWKISNLKRQQFSFMKTSIEIKVSPKILSHVLSI